MKEQRSIAAQLDDIATEMCNNYCKYNKFESTFKDDERFETFIDDICENCPLMKI